MSSFEGKGYVEGIHRFIFDPGYLVCRVECSPFYSKQTQNFCGGCKEMDFLLYHLEKKELWLIEVKDYRFDARPKSAALIEALCKKVRDTLFLLKTASIRAPHEIPLEGVSLREFSQFASKARTIRLGFLLELPTGKLFPMGTQMANIHSTLLRQMRFIDPELVCAPITHPLKVGPWKVVPAHGEESKRIQARHQKRDSDDDYASLKKPSPVKHTAENKHEEATPIPLWKKRWEARMKGEVGNHYSRRKKRLSTDRDW